MGSITSRKQARAIMGTNFFGLQEAIQHFGVSPSRRQLAALSEVPFTEATLTECKDTHILVAVFPLSILDIRGKVGTKLFYDRDWRNKDAFVRGRGKGVANWHLVRKTPVANSTSKTWDEQQALLAANEYVPTACTMTHTIIGHFLATGVRLFENIWVRCSDLVWNIWNNRRVSVGGFGADGLDFDSYLGDCRGRVSIIGVSVARKFD